MIGISCSPLMKQLRALWDVSAFADNIWLYATTLQQIQQMVTDVEERIRQVGWCIGDAEIITNVTAMPQPLRMLDGRRVKKQDKLKVVGVEVRADGQRDVTEQALERARKRRWQATGILDGAPLRMSEKLRILAKVVVPASTYGACVHLWRIADMQKLDVGFNNLIRGVMRSELMSVHSRFSLVSSAEDLAIRKARLVKAAKAEAGWVDVSAIVTPLVVGWNQHVANWTCEDTRRGWLQRWLLRN